MRATLAIVAVVLALAGCQTTADAGGASVLRKAESHLGLREGRKASALVGVATSKVPWCGYFLAVVVDNPPPNYPKAKAWLKYGRAVSKPRKGDILVIRTSRGYHASVFSHVNEEGRYCAIGGNQSNSVRMSCYRPSSVVGIRR